MNWSARRPPVPGMVWWWIMAEHEMIIPNKLGLHARASAKLVQLASRFKAGVFIQCRGREVNAKSIMGLMLLAAPKGTAIRLRTDGILRAGCSSRLESPEPLFTDELRDEPGHLRGASRNIDDTGPMTSMTGS